MVLALKIVQSTAKVGQLHRKPNTSSDGLLGFADQFLGIVQLEAAHQGQFDGAAVHTAGIVPGHGGQMQIPYPIQDLIDDVIKAEVLGYQALELGEHGMTGIGFVLHGIAYLVGLEQAGLGQAVELNPHGIGAFLEFLGEQPEVGCIGLVAEEFEQELDPGLGSNKGVQHRGWARLRPLTPRFLLE